MMHPLMRMAALTAVLAVAGCGALTKTAYQRPAVSIPTQWRAPQDLALTQAHVALRSDPWWHAFGDAQLNALVDQVLQSNQVLATSTLRIKQAEQSLALARATVIPSFAFGGLGVSAGQNFRSPVAKTHSKSFDGASLSYTVDLWGTLASRFDAARWEAMAAKEDWETMALDQIGATVSLYGALANLAQQLDQSEQSIRLARRTLEFAQIRNRFGAISTTDRMQAEQALVQELKGHASLVAQKAHFEHAMSMLLGAPPGSPLIVLPQTLDRPLPRVPSGLPAELLGRRPDLKAAEMRLRASLAQVDATRTSFYPQLSLTGSLTTDIKAWADLLKNPVGTAGAVLSFPFARWPSSSMTVSIDQVQTSHDVSALEFRQAFYRALQEVENALATRDANIEQLRNQMRATELALEIERRSEYAYQRGAISLPTLLNAQHEFRFAKTSLIAIRYVHWENQVALYRALGGSYFDNVDAKQGR